MYLYRTAAHYLAVLQQTDSVRDQLEDTVKLFAAKETDVSLRTWWRSKSEQKEVEYWTEVNINI